MKINKTKSFIGLTALLALVMVFTSACGGDSSKSDDAAKGADGATVIKVQGIGGDPTRLEPLVIGVEKGFFEEEGVTLDDQGVIEVPQRLSALVSGTIDTVDLMSNEGLMAFDNDAQIIQVATSHISQEGNEHMTYLVLKDSDINTGTDLEGKSVGVVAANGGCTAGFPIEFARQAGLEDPKSKFEIVSIPEETLVTSLESGDIDVAGLHLTREQVAKLYPNERVLFTDYDLFEDRGGDVAWYFTKEYADKNADAIKKFVAAIAKTNEWINANPEEAEQIYKEKAISLNPDLFHIEYYQPGALNDDSHAQLWVDLFASGDSAYTLQNKDITPADFTTNEYNVNK